MRGLASAVALVIVVLVVYFVANRLQDLVAELIERVGAVWGLTIVGVATLLLGSVWVRYGGVHALRRWGVVVKPAIVQKRDDGTAESGDDPTVERPSRDPRALR